MGRNESSVKVRSDLHRCVPCNITFTERKSLYRHQEKSKTHAKRVHKDHNTFICRKGCSRLFSRPDIRKRHERETHGNVRRRPSGPRTETTRRRRRSDNGFSHEPITPSDVTGTTPTLIVTDSPHSPIDWPSVSSCNSRLFNFGTLDINTPPTPAEVSTCSSESEPSPGDVFACDELVAALPEVHPLHRSRTHSSAPPMCTICSRPFETDRDGLFRHAREHSDGSPYQCGLCQVGFVHKVDLDHHNLMAENGHCGFDFPHSGRCTSGHHPPGLEDDLEAKWNHEWLGIYADMWSHTEYRTFLENISEILAKKSESPARGKSDNGRLERGSGRLQRAIAAKPKPAGTTLSMPAYMFSSGRGRGNDGAPSEMADMLRQSIADRRPNEACILIQKWPSEEIAQDDFAMFLFDAVHESAVDITECLLQSGAQPNYADPSFGTILCFFVKLAPTFKRNVRRRILELLLNHGADIHAVGPEGSALDYVRSRMEMCEMSGDRKRHEIYGDMYNLMMSVEQSPF